MKKFMVVLILICILLLIAIDVKIMFNINSVKTNLNREVDLLQSQIDDLKKNSKSNQEEKEDKTEKKSEAKIEDISEGEVSKDKFKVATNIETCYYEKVDMEEDIDLGIEFKIADGKAYINLDSENETLKSVYEGDNELKSIENKQIMGFSNEPVAVFYAEFGQDIVGEQFLFLMKDGSVEHMSLVNILKTQEYVSEGKIQKLSNIEKFDILNVYDTEGGGYVTTIAIDENDNYYDINELL